MARLFIAISLTEKQKDELAALQQRVRDYLDGVSWVKPAGMHLTLKYLGETDLSRVELIGKVMDDKAAIMPAFDTVYGKSGVFPSTRRARVIWTGLLAGIEQVQNLAGSIDRSLAKKGFSAERRAFTPHLTIGRLRRPVEESRVKRFLEEESSFKSSSATVKEITLYESELNPRGAIYTVLYRSSFIRERDNCG